MSLTLDLAFVGVTAIGVGQLCDQLIVVYFWSSSVEWVEDVLAIVGMTASGGGRLFGQLTVVCILIQRSSEFDTGFGIRWYGGNWSRSML